MFVGIKESIMKKWKKLLNKGFDHLDNGTFSALELFIYNILKKQKKKIINRVNFIEVPHKSDYADGWNDCVKQLRRE